MMHGIDISEYQSVNWDTLAKSKVEFVIMRAGIGTRLDKKFEANYKEAKRHGFKVGAYWYSFAKNTTTVLTEMNAFHKALKGKQFDMPVYIDVEEQSVFATGINNVTNIVATACNALEKLGYFAGIYTSRCSAYSYIRESILKRYTMWVADYNHSAKTTYKYPYAMWQHGVAKNPQHYPFAANAPYLVNGYVPGINGQCDVDICYQDFPTIIKEKGLNGYTKEPDYILGDVNNDGEADAQDATMTMKNYVGTLTGKKDSLTDKQKKAADVNKDGVVDAQDATIMMKTYVGKLTKKGDKK